MVPILAKDEEKQRKIKEKSAADAQSAQARAIGVSSSIVNTAQKSPPNTATSAKPEVTRKPSDGHTPGKMATIPESKSTNAVSSSAGVSSNASGAAGSSKMETSKTMPRMVIQAIPPFRGKKSESKPVDSPPQQPLSPTSAQKLNANASSFRPNPKAAAFTPVIYLTPFMIPLLILIGLNVYLLYSQNGPSTQAQPQKSKDTVSCYIKTATFASDLSVFIDAARTSHSQSLLWYPNHQKGTTRQC